LSFRTHSLCSSAIGSSGGFATTATKHACGATGSSGDGAANHATGPGGTCATKAANATGWRTTGASS
jgi:hypothetical protein